MKKKLTWLAATFLLAVIFHLATLYFFPYAVMRGLAYKNAREGRQVNILYHAPPVTEESRRVVRPSPDLLYSYMEFDVSETALHITAPIPDTYWSLSIFSSDTENFFVINDRQLPAGQLTLILKGRGKVRTPPEGTMVVEAPTDKGVVLFRMLIKDEADIEDLMKIQKKAICRAMPP